MQKKMNSKGNLSKQERYTLFNRFNKNEEGGFLEAFNKIMIERLLLNRSNQYHEENINKIVINTKRGYRRNSVYFNTDISGGFILSTVVEADFYVLLQERIMELTGKYMPMCDFIHLLLTWFYQYYGKPKGKSVPAPLIKRLTNKQNKLIPRFNDQFFKYYKNISLT